MVSWQMSSRLHLSPAALAHVGVDKEDREGNSGPDLERKYSLSKLSDSVAPVGVVVRKALTSAFIGSRLSCAWWSRVRDRRIRLRGSCTTLSTNNKCYVVAKRTTQA